MRGQLSVSSSYDANISPVETAYIYIIGYRGKNKQTQGHMSFSYTR